MVFGFPKSGKSWAVSLLADYLECPVVDPVADVGATGGAMTHLPFCRHVANRPDFRRGVCMVRDPRDVGGCGQVGSHIAEMLLERGDEVLAIDNFATGRHEIFPDRLPAGLVMKEGAVEDGDLAFSLMEKFQPSHVIHAAAYKDPDDWATELRST